MPRIKADLLIVPAAFIISNTAFAVSAWRGEKWAIIAMATIGIFLAFFYAAASTLNKSTLDLSAELITNLRTEVEYNRDLSEDHNDALRMLAEHDPATAAILVARYKKRLEERWPELKDNVIPLRRASEN